MSRRATILMFCCDYKPDVGGIAELSFSVALELHRQGWRVIVLACPQEGDRAFDADQPFECFRVIPGPIPGRLGQIRLLAKSCFGLRRRVGRLIRRYGVGYVLQTTSGDPLRSLALIGQPVARGAIFHGNEAIRRRRRKPIARTLFRWHTGDLEDVFANSRFTAGQARSAVGSHAQPVVIGCGINPSQMPEAVDRQTARRQLQLGDAPVVLTIGRLVPIKGMDTMIRALPEVLRKHPRCVYVVAGGGEYLPRLQAMTDEMKLGDHVRFEGRFAGELLPYYYCAADLFAMPSRYIPGSDVEGFGIVCLEANYYGLAVIGGRAGGMPDAVVDGVTGLLVDPNDPGDLARAVIQLLDEPELRRRMGRDGHARAVTEMTWSAVAERIGRQVAVTLGLDPPGSN